MTIPPSDGTSSDPYATPTGGGSPDPQQPQQPDPAYPPYPPSSYGQAPPPYGQQPTYPQQPYQQPSYPSPSYGTGYPQQPYGYAPGYPGPQRRNGLAVASMWTSIGGIITCGVGGLVGLILGIVALTQIKRDGTAGRGMAIAGIVVGGVFVALFVLGLIGGMVDGFTDYDSTSGTSWGIDT
ncbi:hypothetical protein GCM10025864_21020 [Luteimicrobium album]|uniref:DUF4190 domain-containing protein n=1 Tax=Luteimicrobium album TaxID=1054550 RepID=A0ABQ6I0T4_9MICO|nr:DUF4190 domain-containing protein [Luteimicrobium album]GMA24343.1 hypothetical protein GCM10025864_21020 [Luteimicrobium album]